MTPFYTDGIFTYRFLYLLWGNTAVIKPLSVFNCVRATYSDKRHYLTSAPVACVEVSRVFNFNVLLVRKKKEKAYRNFALRVHLRSFYSRLLVRVSFL